MAKLDYCIVKENKPNGPCIVYVTFPNDQRLDPTVIDHECFPEIKGILEAHGFHHVMMMTFKSKGGTPVKFRSMNAQLKKSGYSRNQKFEQIIKSQIDQLKELQTTAIVVMPYGSSGLTQNSTMMPEFSNPYYSSWRNFAYSGPPAHSQLPARTRKRTKRANAIDIGGRLDLYVYLFLRTNPTPDKSIEFEFEFDFTSRANNETRRFIKAIQCSFIRLPNDTDNIMYLESEKTLRDIIKEIEILYSIRLFDPYEVFSGQKPQAMIYDAIELKDYLELDGRMSLQINIDTHYDDVLALSEKIRKEKSLHDKSVQIPVAFIKKASESILQRMEHKMLYYSDKENYEMAASYQKNKAYIQGKVHLLNSFEQKGIEKLSNDEYEDHLTMKDLDF